MRQNEKLRGEVEKKLAQKKSQAETNEKKCQEIKIKR